jgi:uncharacterized integral membrane protein
MLKRYIIILIILILIVIFAVQNVEKVAIKLWIFDVNASLSLIIILTFTIGALVTLLPAFQEIRNRSKKISTLENALKSAKKEKEKETGSKDSFSGEIKDKQR